MSQWSHITAAMSVETALFGMDRDTLYPFVQHVLSEAPEITGSESNADVNFFIQSGHNQSSMVDGEWVHSQSCITIVIQGDLRDRDKEEVKQELYNFVTYIDHKFFIRDGSYGLKDDWIGTETGTVHSLISSEEGEE